jgi:membrane associated rhomboid family serine protease
LSAAPLTTDVPARRPPWEAPDLLPEAPSPGTYGCVTARGTVRECSAAELPRLCEGLVWTPDAPRWVPVTEVPLLAGVIDERLRASLRQSRLWMVLGALWAGAPFLSSLLMSDRPPAGWALWVAVPLVVIVLPSLQTVVSATLERRALRRRREGREPWGPDLSARFEYWVGTRPATFTRWMVGALVAVALCQLVGGWGDSVAAAGLVKERVGYEPWRLLTGTLLHGGLFHLGANLGALLSLGSVTEVLTSRSRLALVFLASLLGGSLFSVVLMPDTTSVGASGGILGLLGYQLVLGVRHRKMLPPRFARSLLSGLVWVVAAGILAAALIDNAAHLGGLVTGAALGALLIPRDASFPLPDGPTRRAFGAAAAAVLAGGAIAAGVLAVR